MLRYCLFVCKSRCGRVAQITGQSVKIGRCFSRSQTFFGFETANIALNFPGEVRSHDKPWNTQVTSCDNGKENSACPLHSCSHLRRTNSSQKSLIRVGKQFLNICYFQSILFKIILNVQRQLKTCLNCSLI